MTESPDLTDLASERVGGAVLAASDEFFAPRENLIRPGKPVFQDGLYTERGKWMDGWETRRRRSPGHDWCVVRLGLPGVPRRLVVDTTHFKGNAPQACSIEACVLEDGEPDAWDGGKGDEARAGNGIHPAWTEIVPESPVLPDTENVYTCRSADRATHLRLNIRPDGGVARLRVFGEVLPDWERLERAGGEADLAAVENGGVALAASDEFFGSRRNLILPGRARDMSDGWETRRRRGPGHDWVILRLGRPGEIRRVEVDTLHFKGNAPGSCSLEFCRGTDASALGLTAPRVSWEELLPESKLQPHTLHRFERELKSADGATHARLNIFPDGGVSRLRLWARIGAPR